MHLSPEEIIQLEKIAASDDAARFKRRAEILLFYHAGHPTREIADLVGLSRSQVRYWRRRYFQSGMGIFPPDKIDLRDQREAKPRLENAPETAPITGEHLTSPQAESAAKIASSPAPPQIQPTLEAVIPDPLTQFVSEAKKLKKPGIEPGDMLAEAGRKVLRYHFAQMLLHEEGTRAGEDIEELHDMRVATRRMRAAVEVFGDAFKPKALRPHLKGLRATGRALGHVRDLDVFMEKAQHYLATLPEDERSGLDPLLASWQTERQATRAEMLAYLDSDKYQKFKDDFYTFLSTAGAGARTLAANLFTPQRVCEVAPVLIYTRLATVRTFDHILDTASIDQLHALRIEFKKLRYTVEFFREVLGPEAKMVIDDIKQLQDHLGDLNDAQVATEILRAFLTQWDQQQAQQAVSERQSPEAIMAYLTYRYNERHQLMITFQQAWEHFTRPEFRHNLALAVSVL